MIWKLSPVVKRAIGTRAVVNARLTPHFSAGLSSRQTPGASPAHRDHQVQYGAEEGARSQEGAAIVPQSTHAHGVEEEAANTKLKATGPKPMTIEERDAALMQKFLDREGGTAGFGMGCEEWNGAMGTQTRNNMFRDVPS
ncbi:hypothetical protein K437DRAFT_267402 [Tilletiaria anomala UBC 951]|uniref:Uncharacterized protein n=1 Tax=Tilletiaria anomala (strain ATCC 24038 / CBS 436.72 / UBC 951) TaxID=1037660 RepID=A0A066W745_TILAU|nr:uncharacterized protein K437DRAFT_267402 [Tilletiaria anomala UBC 951]KDN49571.1 hypothetical protein K437DRAFT_267402 [Tilletiaria anomala UBC 951]